MTRAEKDERSLEFEPMWCSDTYHGKKIKTAKHRNPGIQVSKWTLRYLPQVLENCILSIERFLDHYRVYNGRELE